MKLQFIFEKELEKINLIFALMNQISDSSQVHMEHSIGQITFWATNQASVNLRKVKSIKRLFQP